MQVIKEGHEYRLNNDVGCQTLRFVEGPQDARIEDGTTTEEVIEALIDRLTFLNEKFPSPYNLTAIDGLKGAIVALNERTAERVERGVEGTDAV